MNKSDTATTMDNTNGHRPGYKSTKLGWVPEEWEYDFIENYAVRGSGHTPNKLTPEYYNGGIKWISLVDSSKLDQIYIDHTKIEISEQGLQNSSAVLHPKGSVVLSRDAGVGKSAIMKGEMAVSQHFIVWRCGEKLNNLYLYYFLQFQKPFFERMAIGSTIKTIGLPFFKKYKVLLPPLPEQKNIAAILSTWDAAIQALQELIAAKEQQQKGLMQRLLTGEVRFGEFEEPWKEVQLNEIFQRVKRIKTDEENDVDVLTISSKFGFLSQKEKFNRVIAGTSLKKYIHLKENEFAYNKGNSKTYPYGCIYKLEIREGLVPNVYICFKAKTKLEPDFYKHYFINSSIERQLRRIISSSARSDGLLNVSAKDFFKIKVPFPAVEEQKYIAKILNTKAQEIEMLKEKLDTLKAQKKGLMQRLLTGEVRTV